MLQAGVSHNSWGSVRLYVSSVLPVYGPTEKEREGRHINWNYEVQSNEVYQCQVTWK